MTLAAPVTTTFTSQVVPIDSHDLRVDGRSEHRPRSVGSTVTVTFIDGTQATGTVSSVGYNAAANLTTVVLSEQRVRRGSSRPRCPSTARRAGPCTAFDNADPGLDNGGLYYIVVIDATTIRLTPTVPRPPSWRNRFSSRPPQDHLPPDVRQLHDLARRLPGWNQRHRKSKCFQHHQRRRDDGRQSIHVEDRRSPQRPLQHRGGRPAARSRSSRTLAVGAAART